MGLSVGHPPVAVNGTEDPVRTVLSRPISWLWEIFTILAKACAGLDAQLVLSLGSRDQAPDGALAGAPVLAGSICAANRVAEARHAGNHARRAEYSLGVLREKARRYQEEIAHLNGLARAADIVDQAVSLGKPVPRGHP